MTGTRNAPMSRAEGALTAATLADIHGVVDALYRFAAGQDRRVREVFESAFSVDAIVDFTQPAHLFGVTLPAFAGREAIADTILGTTAQLITTHSVSNPRVSVSGESAQLTALVEAQHVLREDPNRNLLLKNFYTLDLSRSGMEWRIDHMKIENAWYSGDPSVLFPDAQSP